MTRNGTKTGAAEVEIGIGSTATAPLPAHGTDHGDITGTDMNGIDTTGTGIEIGREKENVKGRGKEIGTEKERGIVIETGNVIGTEKGER